MSFAGAEADRRIANLISVGTVVSIDASKAVAVVNLGDLDTPPIPVGQLRAGVLQFWWMPEVGEQVVVAAPSGDLAQAVILCSIFAGNASSLDAATPKIDLAGGFLQINGDLSVSGDVVASGISLVNHKHGGVVSGGAQTGVPS